MKCIHCNSEHDPDAYAIGYVILDGEIRSIEGEGDALQFGRENKAQIFWTPEGADDALRRLNGAVDCDLITGELL